MMSKHKIVLPLLVSLDKATPVVDALDVKQSYDLSIYISFEKVILFMIESADICMKNDHKAVFFQSSTLHSHGKAILDRLHFHYLD